MTYSVVPNQIFDFSEAWIEKLSLEVMHFFIGTTLSQPLDRAGGVQRELPRKLTSPQAFQKLKHLGIMLL